MCRARHHREFLALGAGNSLSVVHQSLVPPFVTRSRMVGRQQGVLLASFFQIGC